MNRHATCRINDGIVENMQMATCNVNKGTNFQDVTFNVPQRYKNKILNLVQSHINLVNFETRVAK